MEADDLVLLTLAAVLGVAGQGCAIRAHRAGEASLVAPFDYARLVFATGLGFLLFGDLLDRGRRRGNRRQLRLHRPPRVAAGPPTRRRGQRMTPVSVAPAGAVVHLFWSAKLIEKQRRNRRESVEYGHSLYSLIGETVLVGR